MQILHWAETSKSCSRATASQMVPIQFVGACEIVVPSSEFVDAA